MIHTSNHHEYLSCLRNLSKESHTKELLAEEIERVINTIGVNKFSAIVTDAGPNIQAARAIVTSKYKHILNIRCIAYAINLISKDICNTPFADRMLKYCNTLISYFKSNHQAGKKYFI